MELAETSEIQPQSFLPGYFMQNFKKWITNYDHDDLVTAERFDFEKTRLPLVDPSVDKQLHVSEILPQGTRKRQ